MPMEMIPAEIEIDGHKAVVTYDPDIEMFRGEFVGLRGEGGADFYAKDRDQLIEEGRKSLEVYYDAMDVLAAKEALRRLASGEDEMIPSEMMDRLLDGENPVRVWREHRALSVEELAAEAGISPDQLIEIENGQREADPYTTASLAKALKLDPEDLV